MAYIVEYTMGGLRYWVQALDKGYCLNGLKNNASIFNDDLSFGDIRKKLTSCCDVSLLKKVDYIPKKKPETIGDLINKPTT